MTQKQNVYVQKLVSGGVSWHRLPGDWSEKERAETRLAAVARLVDKPELTRRIQRNGVIEAAAGRNAEQIIGEITVPLSVVGEVVIESLGNYWVPLSTTEGALVASVQRGVKVIQAAGGVECSAVDRGVTRAPVFYVSGNKQGAELVEWLTCHGEEIARLVESTSSHLTLMGWETEQVGRNVWVRLRFDTGEAMGMNMVTLAVQQLVEYIERETHMRCVALSGNACVDKKASWSNVILGRGMRVQAEVVVPREMVQEILKTDPEAIEEVVRRKNGMGSLVSGSMGANGHFANMVAALYLATGQDMAHVVEGSAGWTTSEVEAGDLYFSVTLPNLMLGTVGGGTQLPVQHAALEIMGLGKGERGEKEVLARIVGAVVLAGELSLMAALATGHLARAHRTLGRRK